MSELSSSQGVLFFKKVNGELGYHENGDEDRDRKYVGEIENGLPNGQGTYTNLDGYKYVGEFKNGGRHGKGTYTRRDGSRFVGDWRNDYAWEGNEYDSKLKILRKSLKGRFIDIKNK